MRALLFMIGFPVAGVALSLILGAFFGSGIRETAVFEFAVYGISGGIAGFVIGALTLVVSNQWRATTGICTICGDKTRDGRCQNSLCTGFGRTESVKADGNRMHWVATTWLSLMLISNLGVCAAGLTLAVNPHKLKADIPTWQPAVFGLLAAINVACCIALFCWKRWGFYGFALVAAVVFVINVSTGKGVLVSSLGLLGVAFLYATLQTGGPLRAWPRLK